MDFRDFRRAGHTPTLFSAFLYFDVSFMVWILPGRWRTRSSRSSAFQTLKRA